MEMTDNKVLLIFLIVFDKAQPFVVDLVCGLVA